MSTLTKIRAHRASWGRRTLAVFSVVWLNFALQPCVMALETSHEGDCPHCPPELMEHHDGHDMASMQMPCATSADCGDLDDFNYDGRKLDFEFETPADAIVVLLPLPATQPAPAQATRSRACGYALHTGTSPPLYLSTCTFLN